VTREEAPRGVLLSFRDRPNRRIADDIFWPLALEEGREWVEMNWVAVPEQPEPGNEVASGFTIREATDADRAAIAALEAEVSSQPPLTEAGLTSLYENVRTLRIVQDAGGAVVAALGLRSEPGGWGVIEQMSVLPAVADQLREPLLRWAAAWLRNNSSRRMRRHVYLEDSAQVQALRALGFTPGETGLDYGRPVDAAEVKSRIAERQGHGTLIKFGWWR
jgi:hypothetical protein